MQLDSFSRMVDAFEVLVRGAANHPLDGVAFREEQLRQLGPVLPCGARDQRTFHWTVASLAFEPERTVSSVRSREKWSP